MSNNRQISKNIIYSLISFGSNIVISFLFTPYLLNSVGKEAYSFFPLVNNIIGYTSIFTSAIGSMAGRFVTMAYYKGDFDKARGYFNSVLAGYLLLSLVFSLVGFAFVFYIVDLINVPLYLKHDVQWLFSFSIVSMLITMSTTPYSLGTYVKNRPDLTSIRDAISNIVRILCIILLFYFFTPSIIYMSASAACAAFVIAGFNIFYKQRLLPEIEINIHRYFSRSYIIEVVSAGIWSSLNALSCLLSGSINLLLTNIFFSAAQTADYSIAQSIPNLISTVSAMIAITFTPHFNILYAKGEMEELVSEIQKSIKILSFILAIPIGFFLVNSDMLLQLWVPNAYNETILLLSIIIIFFTSFGVITNPLFGIFTITNKRKAPSFVLLLVGIMNILSIFLLLKFSGLGIYAIAISGCIFIFIRDLFFTPMYGAYCLGLKKTIFYPIFLKGVIAIIVVVLCSIFFRLFIQKNTFLNFVILFTIIASTSLFINSLILMNNNERHYFVTLVKSKLLKH